MANKILSDNFVSDGSVARNAKGNNIILDVVEDYAWTLSPKSARDTVPYAIFTEYQQTTAQLLASSAYYLKQGESIFDSVQNAIDSTNIINDPSTAKVVQVAGSIGGKVDNKKPYEYRYYAEPTGIRYKFPYFSEDKYSRGNQFAPTDAATNLMKMLPGSTKATNFFSNLSTILDGLTPGAVGLMEVQAWKSTDPETYSFSFDLLNTGAYSDIGRNRELCYLLLYQNSPSKRNFFITDPPVIYDMLIPDIVHLPACYISKINVKNKGNTQLIGGLPIPEAYSVEFTVTSLFYPTRNILMGLNDEQSRVVAISDGSAWSDIANSKTANALKSAGSAFSGSAGSAIKDYKNNMQSVGYTTTMTNANGGNP